MPLKAQALAKAIAEYRIIFDQQNAQPRPSVDESLNVPCLRPGVERCRETVRPISEARRLEKILAPLRFN
jgi:hypothetical protein